MFSIVKKRKLAELTMREREFHSPFAITIEKREL